MASHVFREYDIRGNAEWDLNDALVEQIGRALGTLYARRNCKTIAVCRDCRLSSERIQRALCKGLLQTGIDVLDIGVGPTPLLYFAVFHLDTDGGVQITGSHNPPSDNGLKMMVGKEPLFGEDIQRLQTMIAAGDFASAAPGTLRSVQVEDAYVEHLRSDIQLQHTDLRVAIDAGNGAGGPLALRALQAVGLNPVALLCDMDGSFPVHHPDPTEPENLMLLRDRLHADQLDLGIALDGDGDRLGVIASNGEIVWGDRLMIVLSRALLAEHPGAAIIGEVKCSQLLYDDIAARGGRPILWKTGHSLIKQKMKEEGALLAGEMSGHIFFADRYFGYDDAIYAALRLIELLSKEDKTLLDLLADVPATHTTPEIRVPCPDAAKQAVVDRVLEHYRGRREIIDVDGARILFEHGWGLVRASNTQPVLVMRFEADTDAHLQAIEAEVRDLLRAWDVIGP